MSVSVPLPKCMRPGCVRAGNVRPVITVALKGRDKLPPLVLTGNAVCAEHGFALTVPEYFTLQERYAIEQQARARGLEVDWSNVNIVLKPHDWKADQGEKLNINEVIRRGHT